MPYKNNAARGSARSVRKTVQEEQYMNEKHVAEFRFALEKMSRECNDGIHQAMEAIMCENERASDIADSCDIHILREQRQGEIKRLKQKVVEIEAALRRLENGEYGYCEETGEEIGLARLRANPLARLSIEAATRQEHLSRMRAQ